MNRLFAFTAVASLLAACQDGIQSPDDELSPPARSRAMTAWRPGSGDTCPVSVHDSYSTVGPDGKLYPTWHPPVDPGTGCTFGHEHGRDPRGSLLYATVGAIPFGYANEQLDVFDPNSSRHEDHVGHKVEWESTMQMQVNGIPVDIRCEVLTKLHQGTHSKDAFTNNLHELVYHLKCSDGSEIHVTMMTAIGRPGEFTRSCDRDVRVAVGPATPANSPVGGGQRILPDRTCVSQFVLVPVGQTPAFNAALKESWQTSNAIRRADGRILAQFNPYYQVIAPSRFHDPGVIDLVGRTIDVCYEIEPNGDRAQGGPCTATNNGALTGITFQDIRSPFNGVPRFVDINSNRIGNGAGPDTWYTDPFGRNGSATQFPGSIKQFIATIDNTAVPFSGPVIGKARNYGGPEVHAPN